MSFKKNLAGQKYGYLTAISFSHMSKSGHTMWLCKCECGNSCVVDQYKLTSGHSKSCGCKRRELISQSNTTHGMTGTPIHNEWFLIKSRCGNPKNNSYLYYGKRGITICDEWKNNFDNFYKYVSKLEHFGDESYTLDRIDCNKGYEPGNVRWANKKTQSRNRRHIKKYEYNGKMYCLSELAEIGGIKYATAKRRLKNGWNIKSLVETPVRRAVV